MAGRRPCSQRMSAVGERQGQRRGAGDEHDDRPLEQDAGAERRPEQQRRPEPDRGAAPRRRVGGGEHELRRRQMVASSIASVLARRASIAMSAVAASIAAPMRPARRSNSTAPARAVRSTASDGAEERGEPVGPDAVGASLERGAGRLQPVDADGLVVAGFVLEADVDEVAALQHLARSLGEARLVTVRRRQRHEPGKVERQAEGHQQQAAEAPPPPPARRRRVLHATGSAVAGGWRFSRQMK